MKAPFAMSGTTAIHLAPFSTSSGMPLSGAAMISFMTRPAACKRAGASCCPGPANAKVAKDNVNKAIAYFFIKHSLSIPRYSVDELVRAKPAEASDCSTTCLLYTSDAADEEDSV